MNTDVITLIVVGVVVLLIGICFLIGKGKAEPIPPQNLDEIKAKAERGDAKAQDFLGLILVNGKGVTKQGKRIKILAKIPVFPSGWPASPPLVLRSATGRLRRWPTA